MGYQVGFYNSSKNNVKKYGADVFNLLNRMLFTSGVYVSDDFSNPFQLSIHLELSPGYDIKDGFIDFKLGEGILMTKDHHFLYIDSDGVELKYELTPHGTSSMTNDEEISHIVFVCLEYDETNEDFKMYLSAGPEDGKNSLPALDSSKEIYVPAYVFFAGSVTNAADPFTGVAYTSMTPLSLVGNSTYCPAANLKAQFQDVSKYVQANSTTMTITNETKITDNMLIKACNATNASGLKIFVNHGDIDKAITKNNDGTYKVTERDYNVTFSAQGYQSATVTVRIKKAQNGSTDITCKNGTIEIDPSTTTKITDAMIITACNAKCETGLAIRCRQLAASEAVTTENGTTTVKNGRYIVKFENDYDSVFCNVYIYKKGTLLSIDDSTAIDSLIDELNGE